MELDLHRIHEAEAALRELLIPALAEITQILNSENKDKYYVFLPEADLLDQPVAHLASAVARSSNVYVRAARFAGIARAQAKLTRGKYERIFKSSHIGKNDAERRAAAISASIDEHTAMITAEAIAEMAEGLENAARVSSESSRKLLDKLTSMAMGTSREAKGSFSEGDFSVW